MVEVIWAPRAFNDLEALIEYIGQDSPIRAQRFAARMLSRVEALASQPESGSWLPEDDRGIYREIFQGSYRIIYRHDERAVYIVAVYHSARLLSDQDLN